MIRLRPGRRQAVLGDAGGSLLRPPPRQAELPHVGEVRGAAAEEVRVERDDDVGVGQPVERAEVGAESELRAGRDQVAARGSHWCQRASGNAASSALSCAASVGDPTVSVRMRRPAPHRALDAHRGANAPRKSVQVRIAPPKVTA
jgi:hypothetical protein